MNKRPIRISVMLVLVGLMAACSSSDTASSETAAATETDATSAPAATGGTNAPNATSATGATPATSDGASSGSEWVTEGVDRDATIRVATFAPMTTADPHAVGATVSTTYFDMMYDRMFSVGRNSEVSGYLVTDWEFTDNGLVLTLRDDATFQDGSPIDATAVKANLDRARTMETSAYKSQLASIQSVDVVDAQTVQLNLAPKKGATLPYVLGGWAGMMINPKFMDPDVLKSSAPDGVGSGPYKLTSWTPGDQEVAFERVDQHWDKVAGQAARVEIYYAADATQAVNAVTAGQDSFYVAGGLSAVEALRQAEASPDSVQAGGYVDTYSSSGFWMRDKVDPIVREAMSYAIDRDALNALYEGSATTNNQLYPKDTPTYSEEINMINVHDPDKAKELIATAPDGSTSLTMAYVESGVSPQIAELFQAQMAAVGIDLTLKPMTQAAIYQAWFDGEFDILSAGTAGPQHPSTGISAILMRGGVNWGAPDSALPDIQAKLDTADDPALSDDDRNAIYRDILTSAAKENWYLIYNNLRNTSYAAKDIVNVTPELPFQYQSLPDFRYVAKLAN
jgi:peptide/nickel transport system substrate-binding protein